MNIDANFVEAKTTCGNEAEALLISRKAVEQGICACAHVNPTKSFYKWNGDLVADTEFEVTFKLSIKAINKLQELISQEHSYKLPSFYVVPVIKASAEYNNWVEANSQNF